MRIIAGAHRGRRLLPPAGRQTRPITDRVKQSLFDRLASADRLEGAVVLDLFCGTGSLGLECLSRAAAHVTFVERDREAVRRLEQNLEAIGQASDARVLCRDALGAGLAAALAGDPFTLVFFDPPYAQLDQQAEPIRAQMQRLAESCADGSLLVLRGPKGSGAGSVDGWREPERVGYGSMDLLLFERCAQA